MRSITSLSLFIISIIIFAASIYNWVMPISTENPPFSGANMTGCLIYQTGETILLAIVGATAFITSALLGNEKKKEE
jgi:hypothetical protein